MLTLRGLYGGFYIIPNPGASSLNGLCLNLTPYPLSFKERGIEGRGL